jgi:hypothetical protein
MSWIGGGNTIELELELINDRGPGPRRRGGVVPGATLLRQGIQERLCLF